MRTFITFIIALFFLNTSFAQEIIKWASEVMHVTSETTPIQYAASQALHSPNVYPKGEENSNAWRPAKPDNNQYIVVKFDTPIRAQQIAIAETENPGAISKVFAYDSLDTEYLLFELRPRPVSLQSRLLNLFFEKTPYQISYVRVELEGGKVPGYNSIDAIGLSSSNIPINVLIEFTDGVNQSLDTEELSENVNSEYLEQGPLLSPDGKTLYFGRRNHPNNIGGIDDFEDIWYSELDEERQEWLPAKNLGVPLNNPGINFICSIAQVDGETILLLGNRYEKKDRMTQGISMSRKKSSGKWQKPISIEIENDYNYSTKVDYYMSQNADIIIMSVERDDSFGDRDLYVSFVGIEGIWTEPKNLGNVVNSADLESSPFLAADTKTLYFSSKGFRGYGGTDIYVSKRLDDSWENWSTPENMGSGVNSHVDDSYFNLPMSGNYAYFSRGKTDENTDIFKFRVDELFIDEQEYLIASRDTVEIDTAESIAINIDESTIIVEEADSSAIDSIPDVKEVISDEEKEKYFISNERIDFQDLVKYFPLSRDLRALLVERATVIVINDPLFGSNKTELNTSVSHPNLESLTQLLVSDQINKIEISCHTDALGDDDYNIILSNKRAWSVYNYFTSKGIASFRLNAIGYGETIPLVENDTPENRAKNRRMEFKLLD